MIKIPVIYGKAIGGSLDGHPIVAVRISAFPDDLRKVLRGWLRHRCGGAQGNILRMEGERREVALAGNAFEFLRSLAVPVKVEYADASEAWKSIVAATQMLH